VAIRDLLLSGVVILTAAVAPAILLAAGWSAGAGSPVPAPGDAGREGARDLDLRLGVLAQRLARTEARLVALPARRAPVPAAPAAPVPPSLSPRARVEGLLASGADADAKVASLLALGRGLAGRAELEGAGEAFEAALGLAREGTKEAFEVAYALAWNEFERGRKGDALERLTQIAADERAGSSPGDRRTGRPRSSPTTWKSAVAPGPTCWR
jgi:hypothetical protein